LPQLARESSRQLKRICRAKPGGNLERVVDLTEYALAILHAARRLASHCLQSAANPPDRRSSPDELC